ncbi:MAG TPA: hypothetical protein VF313_12605 [Anaerolineaceae bacterium]|jgi:hypothetical protein
MKDNRDLALGWLAKTESDLSAANWILGSEGPLISPVSCTAGYRKSLESAAGFSSAAHLAQP